VIYFGENVQIQDRAVGCVQSCQQSYKLPFTLNRVNLPSDRFLPSPERPGNEHRNYQAIRKPQSAAPPSSTPYNRQLTRKRGSDLRHELIAQGHRPASKVYCPELVGLAIPDQIVCPA
jgi:hypothetical protein